MKVVYKKEKVRQNRKKKLEQDNECVEGQEKTVDETYKLRIFEAVNEYVRAKHPQLKIASLTDRDARQALRQRILEECQTELEGHFEWVDSFLQESVGLGVIEEILQNPKITDISYNGTELILETNAEKWTYERPISAEYMEKLVHKLANISGKEFTTKTPVLDIQFEHLRINAVHRSLSNVGLTVSIRVSRNELVLVEKNFPEVAPLAVLHLLRACVGSMCNLVLSGETGAGKTECQKLLIEAIPFSQRIALVEDVQESHVKELFPNKDVLAWHSGEKTGISELIKAGLRNNPKWIMVTEMRYAKEAYEWMQGIMTDHKSITTIHATSARDIPDRILNMILEEFPVDETRFLKNIKKYIDIGIHLKVRTINGKKIRYISEIVYITPETDHILFTQECSKKGKLTAEFCPVLPEALVHRFNDYGYSFSVEEKGRDNE